MRNPPEGGIPSGVPTKPIPLTDDGATFEIQTCNHHELGEDEVIHEQAGKAESRPVHMFSGESELNGAVQIEIILKNQGPLIPPWARFGESYDNQYDQEPAFSYLEAFETEQLRKVANQPTLKIVAKPLIDDFTTKHTKMTAKQIGISLANIVGENPKLVKGERAGWYSLGLSLSPHRIVGIANLCPFATKACSAACLNESGRGEMRVRGVSWIQEARKRRTLLFLSNRAEFFGLLVRGIRSGIDWTETEILIDHKHGGKQRPNEDYGAKFCFRPNVLSDLHWESIKDPATNKTIMESFPDVQFYDYTKDTARMKRFVELKNGASNGWPKNYHLTFSFSESNARFAFWVLDNGQNSSLIFDTEKNGHGKFHSLPPFWSGYRVIDADVTDLRFLDTSLFKDEYAEEKKKGRGLFCGLRLKGNASRARFRAEAEREQKDKVLPGTYTGGFVQYSQHAGMNADGTKYDESKNITLDADYKKMVIELSENRRREQDKMGFTSISKQTMRELLWEEEA